MLNFPIPYPDELIYSAVARAGVHLGMVSPKCLLDEVFGCRRVIATFDVPNHLEMLACKYPRKLGLTVERLTYGHTLFPLYAPFIDEARRRRCLKWFASSSRESIHLTLGVAASRVKQSRFVRYCPACMDAIKAEFGEYYWARRWQVAGADCCTQHGSLACSKLARHSSHRHQFFAASPALCLNVVQGKPSPCSEKIVQQVSDLLARGPYPSASYFQWSKYYSNLAGRFGCGRGKHVDYDLVRERVLSRWPIKWLEQHGLGIHDAQTCWLRSIFRKHRKSFSYLEHIVVLDSFLPASWKIQDVLAEVKNISEERVHAKQPESKLAVSDAELEEHRNTWLKKVRANGIKYARMHGGGAIYAWLFRHDREWLLSVNRKHAVVSSEVSTKIDWHGRDISVARNLICIKKESMPFPDLPRRSRNWYLSKLSNATTVEKNIDRLPITNRFFKKYCESVSAYQIRRIENTIAQFEADSEDLRLWKLLRGAGLSEERLTGEARRMLERLPV